MLSDELAEYAAAEGIGTLGVDLFTRLMPDRPDNAICIYDEPGIVTAEMHSMDADSFGSHWMIRGSATWVKAKIFEIHRRLPSLSGEFGGIHILDTHIQTPPAFVENDSRSRAVYSAHYIHDCSIGQNIHRTPI